MKLIPTLMIMVMPLALVAQEQTARTSVLYGKGYSTISMFSRSTPAADRVGVELHPLQLAIGVTRNNRFMMELGVNQVFFNTNATHNKEATYENLATYSALGSSMFLNTSWRLPVLKASRLGFWLGPELLINKTAEKYTFDQTVFESSDRENIASIRQLGLSIVPRITYSLTDRFFLDFSYINVFATATNELRMERNATGTNRQILRMTGELNWNDYSNFRFGVAYRLATRVRP